MGTRQEKRRCTENKNEPCTSTSKKKKLKLIRITETSDVSEEEEVDNFEGFHEINATNNKYLIMPKVECLTNVIRYIKKESNEYEHADNEIITLPTVAHIENQSIQEVDVDDYLNISMIKYTANGEDHYIFI